MKYWKKPLGIVLIILGALFSIDLVYINDYIHKTPTKYYNLSLCVGIVGFIVFIIGIILLINYNISKNQHKKREIQEFNEGVNHNLKEHDFMISKRYNTSPIVAIDDVHNRIALVSSKVSIPYYIFYKDIIAYEFFEDGVSISKGNNMAICIDHFAIGFGSSSSNVCTSLCVKLTINNFYNPLIVINFISQSVIKYSETYRNAFNQAQEFLSTLIYIANKIKQIQKNDPDLSHNNPFK
jgi:hypothetical protein